MIGAWLAIAAAHGAPFNAYGFRTDPGTLGLNPYVGGDFGEAPWGSLYVLAGVTRWLDVVVGANGGLNDGRPAFESWELMPRFFPSADQEVALAVHLLSGPEGTTLGPELHLAGYPNATVGLWTNLGARYELGKGPAPQVFALFAAEVTSDIFFVALELNLEGENREVAATLTPSVGAWLGKRQETGLSAGWILPLDGVSPLGVGAWLWRTVDLRGDGRQRRNRPRKRRD